MDKLFERLQARGWAWPLGLGTTVLSYIIWWYVYTILQHTPWLVSSNIVLLFHPALLVTSIMVHEIGHYIPARRIGLRPMIFSLVIGGATYVPTQAWKERLRTVSPPQACQLFLGGVIANAALIPLGLAMTLVPELRPYGQALCYLNGFIIISNLLPIPGLDGGRFWLRMTRGYTGDYSSFADRTWFAVYILLIIIAMTVIHINKLM